MSFTINGLFLGPGRIIFWGRNHDIRQNPKIMSEIRKCVGNNLLYRGGGELDRMILATSSSLLIYLFLNGAPPKATKAAY